MADCQDKDTLVEQIACFICNKPSDVSIDDCLKQNRPTICLVYGKCRIREKTEEQLRYVCSSLNKKIFLNACPGRERQKLWD